MGLENGFTVHRKAVKVMARLVFEWPENRKYFSGDFLDCILEEVVGTAPDL